MRRSFLSLLALCLVLALALHHTAADASADDLEVHEETVDAAGEQQPKLPPLTEDEFASIMMKVSNKCIQQVQANPQDPTKVSDRCRAEVASKIQRFLAKKNSAASGSDDSKKEKKASAAKPKKTKKRKLTRAQREAAEALKKEEEYQKTLQLIIGFVATFVAVIGGVIFFINRKLKDAGMYYPADPTAKSDGCCG
ncbi:hypothetical protein Gpo141_00005610 [Globisporangium polare]